MRGIRSLAYNGAIVVALAASSLVASKAEARSHIDVGIGFGFAAPVYASPYYPSSPVYYAPAPVYAPPPPAYYYRPAPVFVERPPAYYAPGYYGYGARPVYGWSRRHHHHHDDDD